MTIRQQAVKEECAQCDADFIEAPVVSLIVSDRLRQEVSSTGNDDGGGKEERSERKKQ